MLLKRSDGRLEAAPSVALRESVMKTLPVVDWFGSHWRDVISAPPNPRSFTDLHRSEASISGSFTHMLETNHLM